MGVLCRMSGCLPQMKWDIKRMGFEKSALLLVGPLRTPCHLPVLVDRGILQTGDTQGQICS